MNILFKHVGAYFLYQIYRQDKRSTSWETLQFMQDISIRIESCDHPQMMFESCSGIEAPVRTHVFCRGKSWERDHEPLNFQDTAHISYALEVIGLNDQKGKIVL